jgi:hypothetical protein
MIFTKIALAIQYLTLLTFLNLSSPYIADCYYSCWAHWILATLHRWSLYTCGHIRRFCCIWISLFPVAPTLEHRASMKRFVSLQFLNPKTVVILLGRRISLSQDCYLHKHRINADRHPCLVVFEPTTPAFKWVKTIYALDRAATVIGSVFEYMQENSIIKLEFRVNTVVIRQNFVVGFITCLKSKQPLNKWFKMLWTALQSFFFFFGIWILMQAAWKTLIYPK